MINFTRLSSFFRFFVRALGEPGNEAISVDKALKKLQRIPFLIGCALYKHLKYQDYAKQIFLGIMPVLNSLLMKRVALLKLYLLALVSLKIGVCYQKLSSLEFNFHYQYSSHSLKNLFSDLRIQRLDVIYW